MVTANDTTLIRPFLKWAGGKSRVVPELKKLLPKTAKRYIEPFLGGGSVALNLDYPICVVNDANPDVMFVWEHLRDGGMNFVSQCQELFVANNNTEKRYYELRDEFNQTDNPFRKATLFIYLNRHGFNGLCRYNRDGVFNVPQGRYTDPVYFPMEEFEEALATIGRFEMYRMDFREVFQMVGDGDVVYCDPPYMPASQSSNFTSYSSGGFGMRDQIDLSACAAIAAENGATVLISNHYNWYSTDLYKSYGAKRLTKIEVSRTINSNAEKRQPIHEVIAVFKKHNHAKSA